MFGRKKKAEKARREAIARTARSHQPYTYGQNGAYGDNFTNAVVLGTVLSDNYHDEDKYDVDEPHVAPDNSGQDSGQDSNDLPEPTSYEAPEASTYEAPTYEATSYDPPSDSGSSYDSGTSFDSGY